MLNPHSKNEELGARVTDVLLKVRLAKVLTEEEMAALAYACGIAIEPAKARVLHHLRQQLEDAQCQAASDQAELDAVKRIGHF